MPFNNPTRLNIPGAKPQDVIIGEPIAISGPMICRRGTGSRSMCQGQAVPTCDGILKPFEDVEGMYSCGKCGMTHATLEVNGEKRYGAVL